MAWLRELVTWMVVKDVASSGEDRMAAVVSLTVVMTVVTMVNLLAAAGAPQAAEGDVA